MFKDEVFSLEVDWKKIEEKLLKLFWTYIQTMIHYKFWRFQSTFKTVLWAFLNFFLLFLVIFNEGAKDFHICLMCITLQYDRISFDMSEKNILSQEVMRAVEVKGLYSLLNCLIAASYQDYYCNSHNVKIYFIKTWADPFGTKKKADKRRGR